MKIWKSKLYRSRYSRIVDGHLHVEADSRADAMMMLQRLCAATGEAGAHARNVMAGRMRHALTVEHSRTSYAAQDGTWRGWYAGISGDNSPYARWDFTQ